MFIKVYDEKITIIIKDNETITDINERVALALANERMHSEGHDVRFFDTDISHINYNELVVEYTR